MGARLGQHFLFDPTILERIADAARLTRADVVLEIGPGKGTLTRALAARAGRVIAIEADRALAKALQADPPGRNVAVVPGDVLRVPWPAATKICGNIPYRITSPLIERALAPPRPELIVFLVQREVADRLAASPGTKAYGALTAGVQLVATVERLFAVKAGAFRPRPRVESALVRITPRAEPLVRGADEEAATRRLIQACFQRRRQQLQRTLREALGLRPSALDGVLSLAGLDARTRAEEIPPEGFVALARAIPTF